MDERASPSASGEKAASAPAIAAVNGSQYCQEKTNTAAAVAAKHTNDSTDSAVIESLKRTAIDASRM